MDKSHQSYFNGAIVALKLEWDTKKADLNQNDPDMLDEYDFSGGVRGKYAKRYKEGTNFVRLDEDVAAMFSSSEEVNMILRCLGKIIRNHEKISPISSAIIKRS